MGGKNFCVSYYTPRDISVAHEIGQSVMIDNGAYSAWTKDIKLSWVDYHSFCDRWLDYQTTWAVIPDMIDGGQRENDRLVKEWPHKDRGAPVWHLDESIFRLQSLCSNFYRVCFGSSGVYMDVGSDVWYHRIAEAFDAITDGSGRLGNWIHMMRGLSQAGGEFPFSSADSANVARNFNRGNGKMKCPEEMAREIDSVQCPPRWHRKTNKRFEYNA